MNGDGSITPQASTQKSSKLLLSNVAAVWRSSSGLKRRSCASSNALDDSEDIDLFLVSGNSECLQGDGFRPDPQSEPQRECCPSRQVLSARLQSSEHGSG